MDEATFHVHVYEHWVRTFKVKAPKGTPHDEVREMANKILEEGDAEGDSETFEYSYTQDVSDWQVEEQEDG